MRNGEPGCLERGCSGSAFQSWKFCRISAQGTKGILRCRALEAARACALFAALSLTWLLTVQMTPAWQKPLFGLAPSRGFCWRTGCRHSLRSASVLAHQGAPDCVGELRALALRTAPLLRAKAFRARKAVRTVRWEPSVACPRGASGVAHSRVSWDVARRLVPMPWSFRRRVAGLRGCLGGVPAIAFGARALPPL